MSGGGKKALARLALAAAIASPLGLAGLCGVAGAQSREQANGRVWVRDEIRINMRAGPGDSYKILRTLTSGSALRVAGRDGEWVFVSTSEGEEGWVPLRYVADEMPASVALPLAEAERRAALESVETLQVRLASLETASAELEEVRAHNRALELENSRLTNSDRTRQLLLGAGIAFLGILVGVFWRPAKTNGPLTTSKRLKL